MSTGDLPPSRAGVLPLIGGALALDFANTSSGRGGPQCLEHLREPEHLVAWARHAGALDADSPVSADLVPADLDEEALARALGLREAIHRAAAALAAGRSPSAADLAHIAAEHARTIARATLVRAKGRFVWRWDQRGEAEAAISGPVALSAVEVLTGGDLTRIKQCPGEHCGWVFLDLSKNRSRRWCEMEVCGSRAKLKRFREAHRPGQAPS